MQVRAIATLALALCLEGLAMRVGLLDSFSTNDCGDAIGSFRTTGMNFRGQPSNGLVRDLNFKEDTLTSQSVKDAIGAVEIAIACSSVISVFSFIIFALAFIELVGYSVGSKCAAGTAIILSACNALLFLASLATPLATDMITNQAFTIYICNKLEMATTEAFAKEGVMGTAGWDVALGVMISTTLIVLSLVAYSNTGVDWDGYELPANTLRKQKSTPYLNTNDTNDLTRNRSHVDMDVDAPNDTNDEQTMDGSL